MRGVVALTQHANVHDNFFACGLDRETSIEDAENIIIVSHGDLLSVFNSMFLGLEVESLNICEMFGFAGGVSQMIVRNDGKRVIKRISDMSFVR